MVALPLLDGGGDPWDEPVVRALRRHGSAFVPYHGVYATEGEDVLAQVQVIRHPFTFADGERILGAGLDYVVSRPDALGRGLSRRLIEEVHRRETEAGSPWVFLWTHRSWSAHRVYESLGYRDLYSPTTAIREVPGGGRPSLPRGYRSHPAGRRDAPMLDALLRRSLRGRVGMVPRAPPGFGGRFDLHQLRPQDLRVLVRGTKAVGYAHLRVRERSVLVDGVTLVDDRDTEAMLLLLERSAAGRWLAYARTTFAQDRREELEARGYAFFHPRHTVFMGRPLADVEAPREWERLRATVSDPRFSLHGLDCY